MRRITRYVLFELLKVFLVALTGMTLFMMLVGIAQEAIRENLGPLPILRLIPYVLPDALRFAVPGTILFAACSVFGRMSASNEVVAVKSVGASPMTLVSPALVLAFLVSLLAVWLNDVAVSWGRRGVERVVMQSVEEIAYSMLRTRRSYSSERFAINVKRVEGRKLVRPTLTFHATENSPPVVLTAKEAELRFNPGRDSLSIFLTDGEFDWGGDVHARFPDETIEREVALTSAGRERDVSPSDCPLRRIGPESQRTLVEIQSLRQAMAAEAAYQMLLGDFAGLASSDWRRRHDELRSAEARLYRLRTEPWRRWANGFSCFFFVLLGAPLAIHLRNADLWTSFGFCFLPILLVYYPLLMYGVDRAKCGALPPYAVWLGNLILLAAGCWMLRRVNRY